MNISEESTLSKTTTDNTKSTPEEESTLAPISEEEATASMQQSMAVLQQVELTALAVGALFAAGSWFIQIPTQARWAVLVGAVFSSINFRLLIWSWNWLFYSNNPGQVAKEQSGRSAVPRIIIKYLFLLVGLGLLIGGLKLHVVGFMIGLGNVIIAVALAPSMMQTLQAKPVTEEHVNP